MQFMQQSSLLLTLSFLHHEDMFIIDCNACKKLGNQHRQLVTNNHVLAMRRSPAGPIAIVRCVDGHEVEHSMHPAPRVPTTV